MTSPVSKNISVLCPEKKEKRIKKKQDKDNQQKRRGREGSGYPRNVQERGMSACLSF